MPGSVAAASPTTVLPYSLAVAFQQSRDAGVDLNRYQDGTMQSRQIPSLDRKSWGISKALTATQAQALRTFYLARKGPCGEFYFYDVYETSPLFSYDPTGVATQGRYIVCFVGQLDLQLGMARHLMNLSLVEVA